MLYRFNNKAVQASSGIYATVSAETTHSPQNVEIELYIPSRWHVYVDCDDVFTFLLRLTVPRLCLLEHGQVKDRHFEQNALCLLPNFSFARAQNTSRLS